MVPSQVVRRFIWFPHPFLFPFCPSFFLLFSSAHRLVWREEEDLQESVLACYHVDSGDQTRISRPDKCPYTLSIPPALNNLLKLIFHSKQSQGYPFLTGTQVSKDVVWVNPNTSCLSTVPGHLLPFTPGFQDGEQCANSQTAVLGFYWFLGDTLPVSGSSSWILICSLISVVKLLSEQPTTFSHFLAKHSFLHILTCSWDCTSKFMPLWQARRIFNLHFVGWQWREEESICLWFFCIHCSVASIKCLIYFAGQHI